MKYIYFSFFLTLLFSSVLFGSQSNLDDISKINGKYEIYHGSSKYKLDKATVNARTTGVVITNSSSKESLKIICTGIIKGCDSFRVITTYVDIVDSNINHAQDVVHYWRRSSPLSQVEIESVKDVFVRNITNDGAELNREDVYIGTKATAMLTFFIATPLGLAFDFIRSPYTLPKFFIAKNRLGKIITDYENNVGFIEVFVNDAQYMNLSGAMTDALNEVLF